METDDMMKDSELNFQTIYNTYQPKIFHYLARLVGKEDAEDLAQEVFLKVSQALDTFRGDAMVSTWIYRIATNVAMDRLRSPSFRHIDQKGLSVDSVGADKEDKDSSPGDKVPFIDQELIRKEMNECIRGFIEELPEKYRTVIVLSELEDLKNHEIAEILQLSLDTVKIRLHRARATLRKEFEAHCNFYRNEQNELACDLKTALKKLRDAR